MTARVDTPPKTCTACAGTFVRRGNETVARYTAREVCSRSCRSRARTRPEVLAAAKQPRVCARAGCQEPLVQYPGERVGQFATRRYCTRTCRDQRGVPADTTPDRYCARRGCTVVLTRNRGESGARFLDRIYCTRDCRVHADRDQADASADARRAAAAQKARDRRARENAGKPKPVLSVFGDVAPAEPWRPATWR